MLFLVRWFLFTFGLIVFSLGITLTINFQHLGIHPWDVLNVGLYEKVGLSIGTWAILIGVLLIGVSWVLDKSYIRIGTFFNVFIVGLFVDFFLWLDFLPHATDTWLDIVYIVFGIIIMGIGGGMYNAGGVGSGPRDGFMLSIADKLKVPIFRVRIITETSVLLLGIILGGPVFIFTFIFTFIQSPIFQFAYVTLSKVVYKIKIREQNKQLPSAL
ncbi:MAG TPA: YitT family protein [Virgibacillus sp.]|nr:YitT family protein [Virgibacillus sp.]